MKKLLTILLLSLILLFLLGTGCNNEEQTPTPTPTPAVTPETTPTPTLSVTPPDGTCQDDDDCLSCIEKCLEGQCISTDRVCIIQRLFTAKEGEFTNLIKEETKCVKESSHNPEFIAQVNGATIRFTEEIIAGPC